MGTRALRPVFGCSAHWGPWRKWEAPGRKVSGDRTSSLCQAGKTQTPVAALISVPVETVQNLVALTVDLGLRCTGGNWEALAPPLLPRH